VQLAKLVEVSRAVAETSGRLEKIRLLADLLRGAAPDEIEVLVAFLSGSPRQGKIGVRGAAIRAAVPSSAAEAASLTVAQVDAALAGIAGAKGPGSTVERTSRLRTLLERATRDEQDFLVRLLFGELRQGALEGVLVEAVARAADQPVARVRRAAMLAGDLGVVARVALADGDAGLARYSIELFRPVQPMLAEPALEVDEALRATGDASVELKLDGARIQVHRQGDDVRVFSRNLREVTSAVPEIVSLVRGMPGRSAVLDGEAIALRPDGSPHPFQITMRRFGRRGETRDLQQTLPLTPLFFDCILADEEPLLDEPLSRRLRLLHAVAPAGHIVPHLVAPSPADAEAFFRKALAQGHEGVMVKSLAATYAAGRRGRAWMKVKQARTLDLVVLAVEWGSGRRRGWLSNLHLGARDAERGGFVMLGKTFKGLSDEMLAWQTARLLDLEIGRDEYTVYVRPELVVEIAFNDLQESPNYPGALALRFARVKRYREDKPAAEADTLAAVQQIYSLMTGLEPPPRR
jgi:DNA ligase 1